MVRPGWFKDDAGNVVSAEPGKQRFDTLGVIAELAGVACRMKMHIECRFADVDQPADEVPQAADGTFASLAKHGLEPRERLLDWVEVGKRQPVPAVIDFRLAAAVFAARRRRAMTPMRRFAASSPMSSGS